MPRKKSIGIDLEQALFQVGQRPPERDARLDRFLFIVCDTSRRHILELLAEPNENNPSLPNERRSGEIAATLGLSNATTSEHLRQLAEFQLVTSRKQRTVVYYRLADHFLVRTFLDFLHALDRYYEQSSS
jgi:DNA-binding transcriptional ArsR family regulator